MGRTLTALLALVSWVAIGSTAGRAQAQLARLTPSDATAEDRFGWAVAIEGKTLAVSAPQDFQPGGAGAAYLFVRSGGAWVQQARLAPPDPEADDTFGSAIALDGDLVAVGATADDTEAGENAGAVYVFARDRQGTADLADDTWSLQAVVVPDQADAFDLFGISVALSSDVLVVGAWGDNVFGPISGSAFVFRRHGGAWVQEAKLFASDLDTGDRFGVSVAVDGNTLVVGANGDSAFRGAAYAFERVGGVWIETAKLTPDASAGAAQFGRRVTLEGATIVAGALEENAAAGAAYVFQREAGTWTLRSKLAPADLAGSDRFGGSVAIQDRTIAVGALQFTSGNGAVYLFERDGDAWSPSGKIVAPDGAFNDIFGFSAALDAFQLAAGAPLADTPGTDAGAAYVFEVKTLAEQFDDVADQIGALVDSGTLSTGQGTSLLAKLEAARRQAEGGTAAAAVNQLQALINEIQAMIAGGTLPADAGEALIAAVRALLERLQG